MCVVFKIGTTRILFTLSDALSFEDDVQVWLILDKTFNKAVSVLNDGTRRRADSTPSPCFPGLPTPHRVWTFTCLVLVCFGLASFVEMGE